jgi:hypothetical protein
MSRAGDAATFLPPIADFDGWATTVDGFDAFFAILFDAAFATFFAGFFATFFVGFLAAFLTSFAGVFFFAGFFFAAFAMRSPCRSGCWIP